MNIKNWMLTLALIGLGTACSDEITQNTDGPSGEGREIQLIFSGSSEGADYTRAIATEAENKIENLKIYVFASDTKEGVYSYLETWTKGGTSNKDVNTFTLDATGDSWKATIYPHEKIGVPFLKLYCVANMDDALQKDGNKLTLTPIETDPVTGNITNYGTHDSDFEKIYSDKLVTNIKTPLVMSGTGLTKISGSVSKVNIDLFRTVARFDIDNTTTRSQLTIQEITVANARNRGPLYTNDPLDYIAKPSDTADPLVPDWIMQYPDVNFTLLPNANMGETPSAIYVHPNLATDSTYMIIRGTYKSPTTGNQVPVVYTLPIAQTEEGSDKANYIAIKRNNRYKLRIMDVTAANIFGTFEVVDWTSGGGIHVKPDNAAPRFDDTMVIGLNDSPKPTLVDNILKLTADEGSFQLTTVASGHVDAEIELLTRAEEGWLKLTDTQYTSGNGVDSTKFTFFYSNATGQMPYRITLINQAASYDPDLQTVILVSGPLAAPTVSDAGSHTLGNKIDVMTTPTAPVATMYKAAASAIYVNVTGIDGINLKENEIPAGFSVTSEKVDGFTTTYKIMVTDTTLISGTPKVIFRNAKDDTNNIKTEVTIDLKQTEMQLVSVEHDATTYDADTIKVDADELGANTFTFKVKSPQDHIDPNNLGSGSKWIKISKTVAWNAEGDSTTTYTAQLADGASSDKADFPITFTNKLKNAPAMTVTLKKLPSKPKLSDAGKADEMGENTINFPDSYNAAATMFLSEKNSELYMKIDCPEDLIFGDAAANLTIEPVSEGSKIYKITIPANSISSFNPNTPAKVTIKNKEDQTRLATLTITMRKPDASVTATLTNYVNITGSTITVDTKTMDNDGNELNAGNLKFKAPKGSKITVNNNNNNWVTVGLKGGSIFNSFDSTNDVICGIELKDQHSDTSLSCTITITNSITELPETFTVMAKP